MTNCKYITKNGRCGLKDSYAYRHGCFGEDMCKCREPVTNADRIRAMSDEELAKMLTVGKGAFACFECREIGDGECSMKCDERCLEWLQQPAEEARHEKV